MRAPKTRWSCSIFVLKLLRQASRLHLSCDRPEDPGIHVLTERDLGSKEGISPPKVPAPPSRHGRAAFNQGQAPVTREVPAGGSARRSSMYPAKGLSHPWQRLTNTRSSWEQHHQTPTPSLRAKTCPVLHEKGERHLPLWGWWGSAAAVLSHTSGLWGLSGPLTLPHVAGADGGHLHSSCCGLRIRSAACHAPLVSRGEVTLWTQRATST